MFKIGAVALFLSFGFLVVSYLGIYYKVIAADPTRQYLGIFVICALLGTFPVWWPWLKGNN